MLYHPDIDGVETPQVVELVRSTLSRIDPRLVDHGARVAYLAHCMLAESETDETLDPNHLLVLCLLHDVGAYKTNEVDDMLRFEYEAAGSEHSAYGYCFLRWFSPLGDEAEAVLYHHLHYNFHARVASPHLRAASYILFADRLDVVMQSHGDDFSLAKMMQGHTNAFAPDLPRLYEKADARLGGLVRHMRSGAYKVPLRALFMHLPLSPDTALQYIFMLVYSIDFRSEYTTTHTLSAMVIARGLAHYMGLSTEMCRKISLAALLHDLGKMAVPLDILENPGRLSADKMSLMRRHVNFSEEIITGHVSEEIVRIAIRHHEKLDGSGYPYGLSAPELTLPERIMAVADILSALTGERSYKTAYDPQKTISILAKMRDGGLLDESVCNMAIKQYAPLMETVQQNSLPLVETYETVARAYPAARQKLRELSGK